MTVLLYANNAATTLNTGISATATTCVLATGTGAAFPNPGGGQAFYMTFLDALTKNTNEVVLVTARSGDVLEIVRGQQGTTALTWSAGDIATQLWTMGDADIMIQDDELQTQSLTRTQAGGSVNSITATLPSGLTSLPEMFMLTVEASGANTGNVTLTLTLGSTVQSAYPILKYGGSQLNAEDIPVVGYPILLIWSSVIGAYMMCNPSTGTSGSIAGGAANELLKQTAANTTGFVAAPSIVGSVLSWTGSAIAWLAAAVTSFNGRSGAVDPQAGDYTAAQVGAVAVADMVGANQQLGSPGFQVLAGDPTQKRYFIQQGSVAGISSSFPNTPVTFPKQFPTVCLGVWCSCNDNGSGGSSFIYTASPSNINVASFNMTSHNAAATTVYWFAIGY